MSVLSDNKKSLSPAAAFWLIFAAGLFLRLVWAASVPWNYYQHDIGGNVGHKAVIEYIAAHGKLNSETNSWQFSHPQLHHILYAVFYRLVQLFTQDTDVIMSVLEYICAALSMIGVWAVHKILTFLFKHPAEVLFGTFFYTFMPSNILTSRYLNNDSTLILLSCLCFMYAVRWYKTKQTKSLLLTALFASLAMCAKASGVLIVPVIGLLYLSALIKEGLTLPRAAAHLKNFGLFLLVYLPLPVFFFGRMYYLFKQPLGYISQPGGLPETGSLFAHFYFPLNMFSDPYSTYPFDENMKELMHYPEYLLKSSLFGEFRFEGSLLLPRILLGIAMTVLILLIAFCLYRLCIRKPFNDLPLVVFTASGIFLPMAFHISACLRLPYACTYNYRYLAPFMIFIVILLCKAFSFAKQKKTAN